MKWEKAPWVLVLGLSIFFFHYGNYWSAHWLSKWFLITIFFSLAFAGWVARSTRWYFFPIVAYALLSALWVSVSPWNPHRGVIDLVGLLALEKNALYALFVVLMTGTFFALSPPERLKGSYLFLALAGLISTVHTLLLSKNGAVMSGLYSGNPSMNGCLMAALLPFSWHFVDKYFRKPFRQWLVIGLATLTIVAIYRTGASIPIGVFGVTCTAYAWSTFPRQKGWVLLFSLLLAVLLIAGGYFVLQDEFVQNNGRFHIWRAAFAWLKLHHTLTFGNGLGSGQVLIPLVQLQEPGVSIKDINDYFIWLHNDWLQVVFELGVVGLVLCGVPWFLLLLSAWESPVLFGSFAAFSVTALMNYPLRLPIHCFSWLLISCLIIRRKEISSDG